MAIFTLDALNAHKGDALVLRWGTKGEHLALIDGGPASVYDDSILPHLQALVGKDPAGRPRPIVLDVVVVSHVDDDHINGILDLASAVDAAQRQARRLPATVTEVWHNAFGDMEFLDEFAGEPDLQEAIRDITANPAALVPAGAAERPDPTVGDITAGAQSIDQGRRLDQVLRTINVPRNVTFDDRRDFVRDGPAVDLEGLDVTVLAPNDQLLELLRTEWRKELKKLLKKRIAKKQAGISALAAAFDDPSVPNQSSIVLLVEFKKKTMLLTGDARGDHLLEALTDHPDIDLPLQVDLFKVPHHGSDHSNGRELFDAVHADHYVISGNGEHGNPHPEALRHLFESRQGEPITVHLTNHPLDGATKPADREKAKKAQKVLDKAAEDPDVTIVYRDDAELAVSVPLLDS